MRIALIAGGAEPGRDGIGDHARRLAAELNQRGHTAWVLAVNDIHVAAPGSTKTQVGVDEVTALRIPAAMSSARRFGLARLALDNADAEAVLYDFSPTQYDKRGLIWPWARDIASLAYGRKRALLVHEYILGHERGANFKRRMWGRVQSWGFRRFARSLNGLRMATTNALYARSLERDGYSASLVPLYGNIPVLPRPAENWCHARLREAKIEPRGTRGFFCAGFFGGLYNGAELAPAMTMLQAAARAADGRLAILSIGQVGPTDSLWRRWQGEFAGEVAFLALGQRRPDEVSAYIHGLDIGLNTVSQALAGKSGSLAAFLDHGLPTLMLNDREQLDILPNSADALPPGALPLTAQTATSLEKTPLLPRHVRGNAALVETADWVERALA